MLLRFSVANHLSIREPQALSLVASSLKDIENGLIACAMVPGGRLLPAAVIYGANASGKSNFIDAIGFMRLAVLSSHSGGGPGTSVPRKPYALDPACEDAPSIFEVDFVVGGVRHRYGFEALDKEFRAEWLYAFPSNRRQMLFERGPRNDFKFGRTLKGRNRIIADLTRPNSLFISAAAQNDHEQLSKIVEFFQCLSSVTTIFVPAEVRLQGEEVDDRVIRFLDQIGTGVITFRQLEDEVSEQVQSMTQEFNTVIRRYIKDVEGVELEIPMRAKRRRIELGHRGRDGKTIFFKLARESAGTRRLLPLLLRAFWALDKGAPLLIDELDASLHTHACEAVLALFCSGNTNPNGAQLIATTHDTNLLRSPLLRRDQVWFTEKDAEGATQLYPLTDIRTRTGDNLERGYLQGRYGAIPSAELLSDLETAR
jgi:AAA15 family ATPase/GTPase